MKASNAVSWPTFTQIAKFMGPTRGPPMLAPWTLLSGYLTATKYYKPCAYTLGRSVYRCNDRHFEITTHTINSDVQQNNGYLKWIKTQPFIRLLTWQRTESKKVCSSTILTEIFKQQFHLICGKILRAKQCTRVPADVRCKPHTTINSDLWDTTRQTYRLRHVSLYINIYQMDCICQRYHKECSTRTCADDCYNCWKKSKL